MASSQVISLFILPLGSKNQRPKPLGFRSGHRPLEQELFIQEGVEKGHREVAFKLLFLGLALGPSVVVTIAVSGIVKRTMDLDQDTERGHGGRWTAASPLLAI